MPEGFDVFLSHDGRDKPMVEEIGAQLRGKGLHVWLDKWELRPGFPWQEGLEEGVRASRAVAVLVGAGGLGSWQEPEMRAFLARSRREEVPVIPVLIPGCPDSPQLTLFLEALTWVDLRRGLTEDGLTRLIWGITGIKAGERGAVDGELRGTVAVAAGGRGRRPRPARDWRRSSLGLVLPALVLGMGAWLWPHSHRNPAVETRLKVPETWLRGRVVDADDRVLSGVRISRQDGVPGDAVTDSEGRFALKIAARPGERVRLRAERAGSPPGDEFCYAGSDNCRFTLGAR